MTFRAIASLERHTKTYLVYVYKRSGKTLKEKALKEKVIR